MRLRCGSSLQNVTLQQRWDQAGKTGQGTPNGSPPAKDEGRRPQPLRRFAPMATLAQNAPFNPTTANIARIDEWLDHLANEVDVAAHSDALTRYFETLARFWNYSARNCYLIAIQMPTATRVASRKTWESLGRTIKRDQWRSSVQILCPHFRKELDKESGEKRDVLTGFSTGYVFDVGQTEGAQLAS